MEWFKIKLQGIDCMAYEGRPKGPPKGYPIINHLRHGDSDLSIPVTIERFVLVNHWGVLCSKKPIKMKNIGIDGHKIMAHELTEAEQNRFGRILSGG